MIDFEEKRRLEELESEDIFLKDQLREETDRKELIERLRSVESGDSLAEKRQQVKDRLALLTASQRHATNKGKKEKWQFLFMALIVYDPLWMGNDFSGSLTGIGGWNRFARCYPFLYKK